MLSSLIQCFQPLPLPDDEDVLALKLKQLYLGGGEEVSEPVLKEKAMKSRVCKTVLTSYDMSLRDTLQLAVSKLEAAKVLIQQLGGGEGVSAAVSV